METVLTQGQGQDSLFWDRHDGRGGLGGVRGIGGNAVIEIGLVILGIVVFLWFFSMADKHGPRRTARSGSGRRARKMPTIPRQIERAFRELGVEEYPGKENNPRVVDYIMSTPVGKWSPYDATSWCGAFCTFTALNAGLTVPTDGHRARAWLGVGERTKEPQLGDICVVKLRPDYRRHRGRTGSARGGYHVGWFLNMSRGAPVLLSGNVDDRVGIDWYSPTVWEVKGYRVL